MALFYVLFTGYDDSNIQELIDVPLREMIFDPACAWEDYWHWDDEKQNSLNAAIEEYKAFSRQVHDLIRLTPQFKDKIDAQHCDLTGKLERKIFNMLRPADRCEKEPRGQSQIVNAK